MSDDRFRAKKRVGQIYINIPGSGSFSVESNPDDPNNLDAVLRETAKVFWREYNKSEEQGESTEEPKS